MQKCNKYLIFPIAIVAILIDQITKVLIRVHVSEGETISIISNVFNLTHTENTGAAFSLFSGQIELLTVISVIASVLIIAFFLLDKSEFGLIQITGWGLLLGGTIGNLIDRFFFHRVTDFFDFIIINFPVFNIADVCIDIGAAIIIIVSFIQIKNDKQKQQTD